MKRISLAFLVLLYIDANGFSQTDTVATRAAIPRGDSVVAGFYQSLSTLNWIGTVNKSVVSDNYSFAVNENFQSVLIKSSPNLIRDDQNFYGQLNRRITGGLFGFGSVQSDYVNDSRQVGLSSVGASQLLGGLFYAGSQDTLLAGAGNKWDRQAGVSNSGFTYTLRGTGTYEPTIGSELLPSFVIHDEQISPRRNSDKNLAIVYRQIFSPQALINFSGAYMSQLRDFYFPADTTVTSLFNVLNNIQERNENRTSLGANVVMPLLFFQLTGTVSYAQRQIDFSYRYRPDSPTSNLFDTRIRTMNFGLHGDLLTTFLDDTVKISMDHKERSESHTIINSLASSPFTQQQMLNQEQLDNFGTRNTLSGQLYLHFGPSSLSITGLASLFRYNTPSSLNYDDRDELTNTLAMEFGHTFSPAFNAGFGMEADLIHIVYIKSQRSANNNRNYIVRFFPMISYTGRTVNSYNRFEVLANYTVYDYEAFSQVHSFSFRQASFLDSTTVRMTSKLSLFLLANVKLYERGELYWSSFSEYPLNYFVDQTFWLSLSYTSGNVSYGAGYKYLSLVQYDYLTSVSKKFSSQITNSGPTAFISARFSRLVLNIDGWYQVSRQLLQNDIVYPNFDLTVKYVI